MEDWQKQVIHDKEELVGRIDKLSRFLMDRTVDGLDYDILVQQAYAMETYLQILKTRIKRF